MPRVPTTNGDQIRQRGIGQQRTNFGDVGLQGVRQAGQKRERAVNQAGQAFTQNISKGIDLSVKYKQQADQQRVTQETAKISDLDFEALNNSDTGLLNTRGENAFGAREQYEARSEEIRNEALEGLSNDDQKAAFNRNFERIKRKGIAQIERHTSSERSKFDKNNTSSILKNSQSVDLRTALSDVDLTDELNNQRVTIVEFAEREGMSTADATEMINESTSKTYVNAINEIILSGNDQLAAQKLKQYGDFIDTDKKKTLRSAIKEGSIRSKAAFISDKIIGGGGSVTERVEKAREIKDPEIRDLTVKRILSRDRVDRELKKQQENDDYKFASQVISDLSPIERARKGSAQASIPILKWQSLSAKSQEALERQFNPPKKTDEKKYRALTNLSSKQIEEMSQADMEEKYLSHLNTADRRTWDKKIKDIRTGKNAKLPKVNLGVEVTRKFKEFGLIEETDKISKLDEDKAKLYRVALETIEDKVLEGIEKGRPLEKQDIEKEISRLLAKDKVATIKGRIYDSDNVEVSQIEILTNDKVDKSSVKLKKESLVPIKDVPKDYIRAAQKAARDKNIALPSTEQIQRMWTRRQLRGSK